jgi:geranylgeranyl pyrophosphate synthase
LQTQRKAQTHTHTHTLLRLHGQINNLCSSPIPPPSVAPPTQTCNYHHHHRSDIVPNQRRLAEIIEMIHTASLVHDDVLDGCSVRRGACCFF